MTFEKGAESVAPRPGLAAGIQPPASALSAGRDLPLHGCKGGLVRDSIADIESFRPASPGWPASIGMGGRLPSESVAGLHRYQWPLCVGLRSVDLRLVFAWLFLDRKDHCTQAGAIEVPYRKGFA